MGALNLNYSSFESTSQENSQAMDPKLKEVSQLFDRFKASFIRNDFDTCSNLLSQLKVFPTQPNPNLLVTLNFFFASRSLKIGSVVLITFFFWNEKFEFEFGLVRSKKSVGWGRLLQFEIIITMGCSECYFRFKHFTQ